MTQLLKKYKLTLKIKMIMNPQKAQNKNDNDLHIPNSELLLRNMDPRERRKTPTGYLVDEVAEKSERGDKARQDEKQRNT